jgi:hypothetical protein
MGMTVRRRAADVTIRREQNAQKLQNVTCTHNGVKARSRPAVAPTVLATPGDNRPETVPQHEEET